ncbi:methyltransferase domain-containing protein [Nonomuraea basaltis]|uniref:methyltransferase domain-containing protein n=1 Tax=Nonomuraea basaltis TaxID=2495887 RepID=UPI00110C4D22|nr:methyltransferase domain-containing protein [Nonomuraea basaltis]TMR97237.1 methyltransferase domain-containing protein [Nonomuraea basaltis]
MTLSKPTPVGIDPGNPWYSMLRCLRCHAALRLLHGELTCQACASTYPIDDGIPRFVPQESYAEGFGYQWNRHRLTQLDSYSGMPISRDRVMNASGWTAEELRGKTVLECGSGAGRFTEVLCETGAIVTSFDISSAVHANAASNGRFSNLRLLQASIYDLPLPEESFDYLICFGVIQHTPDVERTFKTLFRYVRPGGRFCIDVYAAPIAYLHPRHLLRPVTRRIPPARLYGIVQKIAPKLLPLSMMLTAIPRIGAYLARLVPVANHRHLNLPNKKARRDWSVLDTFDWFAPRYERPQTRSRLQQWTKEVGLSKVSIERHRGLYVISGIK